MTAWFSHLFHQRHVRDVNEIFLTAKHMTLTEAFDVAAVGCTTSKHKPCAPTQDFGSTSEVGWCAHSPVGIYSARFFNLNNWACIAIFCIGVYQPSVITLLACPLDIGISVGWFPVADTPICFIP